MATFTDDGVKPLVVVVQRGGPHGYASLPADTEAGALDWTCGFAAALNVPQVFDVTPGRYDPERGAVSLTYQVRGPSSARLMLGLPDSHPLWKPVLAVGGDPESSKCVLEWLLGGKPYASDEELRAHTPNAARECGYSEGDASEYIAQLGAAEFAPAVSSITCLAFLTRAGTLVTLTIAPLERAKDIDRVVATLWEQSVVDPEARLPVEPPPNGWFSGGRLVGVVLGSFAMIFGSAAPRPSAWLGWAWRAPSRSRPLLACSSRSAWLASCAPKPSRCRSTSRRSATRSPACSPTVRCAAGSTGAAALHARPCCAIRAASLPRSIRHPACCSPAWPSARGACSALPCNPL